MFKNAFKLFIIREEKNVVKKTLKAIKQLLDKKNYCKNYFT